MEWNVATLVVAAALAGFSKGFAAFGTALVYVPIVTLAYDARTAVVTLFLVDIVPSIPVVFSNWKTADKHLVGLMGIGALIGSPFGIMILTLAPPSALYKLIGAVILLSVANFVLRPDVHIRHSDVRALVAGLIAGVFGGACGLYGPPALIYLISVGKAATTTRASMFLFFAVQSAILGAMYGVNGMFQRSDIYLSCYGLPAYAAGFVIGSYGFRGVDDNLYRKILLVALSIIAVVLIFFST